MAGLADLSRVPKKELEKKYLNLKLRSAKAGRKAVEVAKSDFTTGIAGTTAGAFGAAYLRGRYAEPGKDFKVAGWVPVEIVAGGLAYFAAASLAGSKWGRDEKGQMAENFVRSAGNGALASWCAIKGLEMGQASRREYFATHQPGVAPAAVPTSAQYRPPAPTPVAAASGAAPEPDDFVDRPMTDEELTDVIANANAA